MLGNLNFFHLNASVRGFKVQAGDELFISRTGALRILRKFSPSILGGVPKHEKLERDEELIIAPPPKEPPLRQQLRTLPWASSNTTRAS